MTTNYPSLLDNTTDLINDATDATPTATTHAQAHNNIADTLLAIETALGTNPFGSYATVAAALLDALKLTPTATQIINTTNDTIPVVVKHSAGAHVSDLFEAQDHLGDVLAFISASGVLSAQGFKVNGVALGSEHLADAGTLQKKSQVDSFSYIQGVTPGLAGNPQTVLQVSANTTWVLNIAAGSALIQGTDNSAQTMYAVTQSATFNLTLGTQAPTTNPRIDLISIQYNDSAYTGRTPADAFAFVQTVGTPTAGATLSNLSGAPANPVSAVPLAYILINPSDTGVQVANVLDARILSGPGVWGEDGHLYRIAVDVNGRIYLGQVI